MINTPPLHIRRNIPFYCHKSEADFRRDIYERYDDMVVRQMAIHLADELWANYPFQPVLDFIFAHLEAQKAPQIAEIGCSVGRLIGS